MSSKFARNLLFILVVLVITLISSLKPDLLPQIQNKLDTPVPQPSPIVLGTTDNGLEQVSRVVDGDTFELVTGQKVRLIGINAPESVDPRRGVQCFGKQASDKLHELINSKQVKLEKDVSEVDKYGRLLRYAWVEDLFINEYLVRTGFAKSSTYPPDVKYQALFKAAENEARTKKIGLWSPICSVSPSPMPSNIPTQ